MYLEALVIGFIIGAVREGRIMYFNASKFKGWALTLLAFVLYVVPYFLHLFKVPFAYMPWLSYSAIVIVGLVVLFNVEKRGMKLILLGLILNLIVMGFYGGKMPIDTEKMSALGYTSFSESVVKGNVMNYIDISEVDGFQSYLGKMIALPKFYPLAKVLSVGDLLVSLGIVLLVQSQMLLKNTRMRGSMLQFKYKSKF